MAISHVQQFGAFAAGSPISATTGNVTVTAGNALIVGVLGFNIGGGQTASASDTLGNTWNTAVGPFQGTIAGSTSLMYVFYVKKLNASGTTAVTITFSVAPNNIRVHCHEVSGLDQTSPFDQMNTNTATSAAMTSGNVTTLFANEFLYGYGADNSGNPTTGVGWTAGITEGSELDEWQIVSATGTYAATYTGDGAAYMCEIATFKGIAAPPPSGAYSVPDCRVPPAGPNANRTVNATKIYDVQTSSNPAIPPTDSRVAPNIPVDSRVSPNIPQNSRTPGVYGPGVN